MMDMADKGDALAQSIHADVELMHAFLRTKVLEDRVAQLEAQVVDLKADKLRLRDRVEFLEGQLHGTETLLDGAMAHVTALERQRESFDCQYAGRYAEMGGIHCPIGDPCQRCRMERAEAEVERLTVENAICREAIEHALELVGTWADDDENDDDHGQGAARAQTRMLNEAIGKAVPRLLFERPEGQRLYGLNYRDLRARVAELEAALAHYATDEEPWGWVAIEALRGAALAAEKGGAT